jgi:NAD(P)H-dependent FMN reductase
MNRMNLSMCTVAVALLVSLTGCTNTKVQEEVVMNKTTSSAPYTIGLILGSTRQGRSSDKIAQALMESVKERTDVTVKILDLRDFGLPFLEGKVSPSSRKVITDPVVQHWADTVRSFDGFIVIVPEYNRGYPAVLKNALDSLYAEWKGKAIGFVGYSGSPSGAAKIIKDLEGIADELRMQSIATSIHIPSVWKAFDAQGVLVDNKNIVQKFNAMIDELIATK